VLQKNTERRRALKVMLPSLVTDPEMRARFELEARVAAGIESEHIVETLDAGIDEATGMPFIVMELLKGEELGRMLKERKRLPPDEVVTLLYQAAIALDKTHAAGIVHRDLKPENMFITRRDDGSPRLKILDFGVAKIVADGTVNASSTKSVGSPLYMAPEQISGDQKIGPAVDRYALAHIAFTLLVGKPYWHRARKAAEGLYPYLMQVMRGAQSPASERAAELGVSLSPAFDTWFAKATTPQWAERFGESVEQILALAEALDVAAPAKVLPKRTRLPLPSIVPASEMPLSVPSPPAAPESAANPTVAVGANRNSVEPKQEPSMAATNEPPASVQEPSSAALTRSNELMLGRADGLSGQRRKSVSPLVAVLLLAAGVLAVVGAFVLWPKRPQSAVEPASAPPVQATTKTPETSTKTVAVAAPTSEPAPIASVVASSATDGAPLAIPVASATPAATPPGLPSGVGSAANPTWKTKTLPRKGTNPLDEY